MLKTPAELSRTIITHGFKTAANRLSGAYLFLGAKDFTNALIENLSIVGVRVTPENPFVQPNPLISSTKNRSPYAARITALWSEMRLPIIKIFPREPGIPKDVTKYLSRIDELYKIDAYHSLSIEGYKVSLELIEHVKNRRWNPDNNFNDTRNALAAKGYYEAFLVVKKSISKLLHEKDRGSVIKQDLQLWYRKLFSPSVDAGIIPVESLLGFRTNKVHIRGSRYSPPPYEAVVDAMEALFECIKSEDNAAVRAVLGHYLFVFIHPYMDGNGRMSRFLMNAMFASGGYPWTIIEVENRSQYMSTLKVADEERDIIPFAQFILKEMQR